MSAASAAASVASAPLAPSEHPDIKWIEHAARQGDFAPTVATTYPPTDTSMDQANKLSVNPCSDLSSSVCTLLNVVVMVLPTQPVALKA